MTTKIEALRDLIAGGPAAPEPFRHPLERIREEHDRQCRVCDWIDSFSDSLDTDPVPEEAAVLLTFLTEIVPLHTQDEEKDLFPLLKRRCQQADNFVAILAQLSREHELDKDLVDFIVADLKLIAGGIKVPHLVRFFVNLRGFSETQRRHIAWENRVLLPLAAERLTEADQEELGRAMADRRNIPYPG